MVLAAVFVVSCRYDDSRLNDEVDSLRDSIQKLINSMDVLEDEVEALQKIVNALSDRVYVVSVVETGSGYTINFSDDTSVTISNGDSGESIFSDVRVENDEVVIVLKDGTQIRIPRFPELYFGVTATDGVEAGCTEEFALESKGVEQFSVVKPTGWKVRVDAQKVYVTAPEKDLDYAEYEGTIDFIAVGGGLSVITKVPVYAYVYEERQVEGDITLDFEGEYHHMLMAESGDCYGEPFYGLDESDPWGGLTFVSDEGYDVSFGLNFNWGGYHFYNGGLVPSRCNDMQGADYTNQLSVYYRDPVTGAGGYDGSQTFIVHNGYTDAKSLEYGMDSRTKIIFATPRKLKSVQIANSTYAYISMRDGSALSQSLNYANKGWFKIKATALDADEKELGSCEFYLADFRESSSCGLLEGWHEFNLSSLPECQYLMFNMEGSDSGENGLNTPAYFCMDNLVWTGLTTETVKVKL